mgnify:CR=1 FL=1
MLKNSVGLLGNMTSLRGDQAVRLLLKQTRLLRLEELHNDGLLTDAEYQAKREEKPRVGRYLQPGPPPPGSTHQMKENAKKKKPPKISDARIRPS